MGKNRRERGVTVALRTTHSTTHACAALRICARPSPSLRTHAQGAERGEEKRE